MEGNSIQTIITGLTNGFTTMVNDAMGGIASILPVVLPLLSALIVIAIIIRVVQRITGRRA